jgi:hypothetical protein
MSFHQQTITKKFKNSHSKLFCFEVFLKKPLVFKFLKKSQKDKEDCFTYLFRQRTTYSRMTEEMLANALYVDEPTPFSISPHLLCWNVLIDVIKEYNESKRQDRKTHV